MSGTSESAAELECPICGEAMVALVQLNQHLDDVHSETQSLDKETASAEIDREPEPLALKKQHRQTKSASSNRASTPSATEISTSAPKTTPKPPTPEPKTPESKPKPQTPSKKSIRLDLYDDSGFGISDMLQCHETLSRAHWKKAPVGGTCHECGKTLSVRNGIVNCRKCGDLFCNEHTKYTVRLANPPKDASMQDAKRPRPPVYDSRGRWAQVCRGCYDMRPAAVTGPQAGFQDVTDVFVLHRAQAVEQRLLARQQTVHRYLQLVDVLTQALEEGRLGVFLYIDSKLHQQEREIVPWESDREVTHCRICFEPFGVFLRKHHCRLCGQIVNEARARDSARDAAQDFCSVQVPVPLLLARLPHLNYTPRVRLAWARCVQETSDNYSFRCCRTCKDLLVEHTDAGECLDVLEDYSAFLRKKSSISALMAKYRDCVQDSSDKSSARTSQLRAKLSDATRDLEAWFRQFMARYFEDLHVARDRARDRQLISNVHSAALMFLQDTLVEVKAWHDEFRESEKRRLEAMRTVQDEPQLTRRQIRELREQLMVLNEQRFIVQSAMDSAKRARRFDELVVLEENEGELQRTIAHVTQQLGEHAFQM